MKTIDRKTYRKMLRDERSALERAAENRKVRAEQRKFIRAHQMLPDQVIDGDNFRTRNLGRFERIMLQRLQNARGEHRNRGGKMQLQFATQAEFERWLDEIEVVLNLKQHEQQDHIVKDQRETRVAIIKNDADGVPQYDPVIMPKKQRAKRGVKGRFITVRGKRKKILEVVSQDDVSQTITVRLKAGEVDLTASGYVECWNSSRTRLLRVGRQTVFVRN